MIISRIFVVYIQIKYFADCYSISFKPLEFGAYISLENVGWLQNDCYSHWNIFNSDENE